MNDIIKTGTDRVREATRSRLRKASYLARDMGVSNDTLHAFAEGKANLSPEIISKLAEHLFPNAVFDHKIDRLRSANKAPALSFVAPDPYIHEPSQTAHTGGITLPPSKKPQPSQPLNPGGRRNNKVWRPSPWHRMSIRPRLRSTISRNRQTQSSTHRGHLYCMHMKVVATSVFPGTFRTCRDSLTMSVDRGKADLALELMTGYIDSNNYLSNFSVISLARCQAPVRPSKSRPRITSAPILTA